MKKLEEYRERMWEIGHSKLVGVRGFFRTSLIIVPLREKEEKKGLLLGFPLDHFLLYILRD